METMTHDNDIWVPGDSPDQVLPAFARSSYPKRGMEFPNFKELGILMGIGGGSSPLGQFQGYNQASDILTQTSDGVDINALWEEFSATILAQNESRTAVVRFLTFPVTQLVEAVGQASSAEFEEATEYGEPIGARPATGYFTMGYDFRWYDLAARFTWKFLADAQAQQVEAINAMALDADNRLIFRKVMNALFRNTNRIADINGQAVNVYSLYNADGTVPPSYKTNAFAGTHSHYMISGGATVNSVDLDDLEANVTEHGYYEDQGYTLALMVNKQESKVIRQFRVSLGASWDFIPAQGTAPLYLPRDVTLFGGTQPADSLRGLKVVGRYGNLLIVEEDYIPAGYMVLIATGGEENLGNPVGFRQHINPTLQGLRLVKGPVADYPLIDSFYNRGFGTGVRQRGGAAIMQIKAAGSYDIPASFA